MEVRNEYRGGNRVYVLFLLPSVCFRLEGGNNLGHCLAPDRITLPTSLDHLPRTIRELRMVRPSRPTSFQHRMNPRDSALIGKRRSFSENLNASPISFSRLSKQNASFTPTSQARTANAYTSLAIVAPVSVTPHRRGSISSGAAPWNDRSMSIAGISDGTEAVPKPAMRTCPSLSTRILVWKKVSA